MARTRYAAVMTAVATAVLVGGCAMTPSGGAADAQAVSTSIGPPGTVGAAHTALGTVLVDGRGRTLYELSTESGGSFSCTGACLSLWPPSVVPAGGTPTAAGGVVATLVAVTRPDGTVQVSADGHPLYTYSGDTSAGQTHGQGISDSGGTWHALTASGAPVTGGPKPASSKPYRPGY